MYTRDTKKIFLNYYNQILEQANNDQLTSQIQALRAEAQKAIQNKDKAGFDAAIKKLEPLRSQYQAARSNPPAPAATPTTTPTSTPAPAATPTTTPQAQDTSGSLGFKGIQGTVNPNPSGTSPSTQKWIDEAPWYEKPFRQMGAAIYGDPEYDEQLKQANMQQGKENIQQFSPLAQNQRLNDLQKDQSFREFQAQSSPAGPYPGAPTPPEPGKAAGPVATPEFGRSVGQKFVQATTGNAPTNTGAPNQAEIDQMNKLHGSFNPKSPGDLKKLDDLRQAQQQLGPNADPKALANKVYALQYSREPKKSAAAARPGGNLQPGVVKTPSAQQQQAAPQQPRPTVPNSTLGGIPGSISNAIGRVGNTAENLMKGQLGQGAQSRPAAQPAQQPTAQQSQQRRKPPVYSKAGGR